MSITMSRHITTYSAAQTWCLGECLGQRVHQGLVIRLTGDLGAGKTCFVQGMAKGLEVPQTYYVTSPSYTLINEYPARLPFYHADLYRIGSVLDADGIGLWDLLTSETVVVVEWSDRLADKNWPIDNLHLSFEIQEDQSRAIDIIGCGLHIAGLIEEVVADYANKCAKILK